MNCAVCSGIDPTLSNVENGIRLGVSEATIRRHKNKQETKDPFFDVPNEIITSRGKSIRTANGWEKITWQPNQDKSADYEDIDVSAILNRFDRAKPNRMSGSGAFVISWNDWQYGKSEGGGSVATVERIKASVEAAKDRVAELRSVGRELGTLVIIGGGDMVEGCFIYPNQSFNIDLHRHDQLNGVVEMILWGIDQLASLFPSVQMLVVKGNHGENRVGGKKTHAGDNDDTLVFKMAKKACDRDPALRHVRWTIAEDSEECKTLQIGPWTLGTTHGDVFGKTPGQNSKKAWEWYKKMRAGSFDVGDVDVLVTHHFHHEEKADWGKCLWVQTRAQDGGSSYFESMAGQYSQSGMLSFVMTESSRYQDEAYL